MYFESKTEKEDWMKFKDFCALVTDILKTTKKDKLSIPAELYTSQNLPWPSWWASNSKIRQIIRSKTLCSK